MASPSLIIRTLERVMQEGGLTQAELMEKHFGIKPSNFSQWKKGRSYPEDKHLAILAELSGVPLVDLLMEKDRLRRLDNGYVFNRKQALDSVRRIYSAQ